MFDRMKLSIRELMCVFFVHLLQQRHICSGGASKLLQELSVAVLWR